MRLVQRLDHPDGNFAKVYYDYEWGEYIVKFYNHRGVHMDASDYHTDSKEDAILTAKYQNERYQYIRSQTDGYAEDSSPGEHDSATGE